jgi:ABC-type multidrug transport system fused ATPase/permease subunit
MCFHICLLSFSKISFYIFVDENICLGKIEKQDFYGLQRLQNTITKDLLSLLTHNSHSSVSSILIIFILILILPMLIIILITVNFIILIVPITWFSSSSSQHFHRPNRHFFHIASDHYSQRCSNRYSILLNITNLFSSIAEHNEKFFMTLPNQRRSQAQQLYYWEKELIFTSSFVKLGKKDTRWNST